MTKKPALAAITLLSATRDERSFHPMFQLFTDRHDGIRLTAAEALGTLPRGYQGS
jgi:HEAT repeat protein